MGFQRPLPSCTAIPALGGADSRARRAGESPAVRSEKSRGFLRVWTPGPRKKAPGEGAGKATRMGEGGPLSRAGGQAPRCQCEVLTLLHWQGS